MRITVKIEQFRKPAVKAPVIQNDPDSSDPEEIPLVIKPKQFPSYGKLPHLKMGWNFAKSPWVPLDLV